MKNKAFTLIELLAVIVVLGIIMLIAITSVSGVIEKSKKDAFIATARAYVDAARKKVLIESIELPTVAGDYIDIELDSSMSEKGGTTSPYGNQYDLNSSFASVTCNDDENTGTCIYEYSIYLTDGVYEIDGNKVNFCSNFPVSEKELDSTYFQKIGTCDPK